MSISIEVKVTMPKELFKLEVWRNKVIEVQNNKTKPEVQKLFRQTVSGWEKKPRFYGRRVDTTYQLGVFIHPAQEKAGEIFALVNEGSPSHPIPAKPGGLLVFKKGYKPSTRPRVLNSVAKQRSDPIWRAKVVNHPGFKAREFTAEIAKVYQPVFVKDMYNTLRLG